MPNAARPNILIADDQRDVREALRLLLKAESVDSAAADGPRAALDALRKQRFDADVLPMKGGIDGAARVSTFFQRSEILP